MRARVATQFGESPRSRFVIDLRNYLAHYELPATEGSLSWSEGEDLAHSIQLDRDRFGEWKGWKALAKQYIDQRGDSMDLYQTLAAYVDQVNEFQRWFGASVVEAHSAALAETQAIASRHDALVIELPRMTGFDIPPDSSD